MPRSAEILPNPGRGPLTRASPRTEGNRPAGTPIDFHRRLPGYDVTPLVDAAPLADGLGLSRLWVKNEARRLGLPAFKMLGASWASYRLLVDLLGHEPRWSTVDELAAAVARLRAPTPLPATDR